MKVPVLASLLSLSFLVIFSCKKNGASGSTPQTTGTVVRIQSSATNLTSTVFLVHYNTAGNITSVDDSVNGITYNAIYDGSNNLIHIAQVKGSTQMDSVTYTYSGGVMTGRRTSYINTFQVTTFYYSGGLLVADSTYFYDNGSLFDSAYTTYQVTNGDISFVEINDAASPLDSVTFTYSGQANPFKQLSLFNWTQGLQNIDVASPYTYFDQHALASYSDYLPLETRLEAATYTFNAASQVIEAQSLETNGGSSASSFDWLITYP